MNKLIEVQEIIFKEMKRLNDNKLLSTKEGKKEIERSTALYNQSTNFIKAINTNLKIMDVAKKTNKRVQDMNKLLGLETDEKI